MRRSFVQRAGYEFFRLGAYLVGVALFRIRCHGRRWIPQRGGVLVCTNHQSFFDPVLVGMVCDRRLNYLARKSLFSFAPFRWLIRFLDAIPIDREGGGLEGVKETLRRLRRGEMVLMFPEGTRTTDGELGPLKPGVGAIARRAKSMLLPVAIDGAFQAWPRNAWLPMPAEIHVVIGEPISTQLVGELSDDELIAELARRISVCHDRARRGRDR